MHGDERQHERGRVRQVVADVGEQGGRVGDQGADELAADEGGVEDEREHDPL